jgi:hypothetical protein
MLNLKFIRASMGKFANRYLPFVYRLYARFYQKHATATLNRLVERYHLVVQHGPFKGLRLIQSKGVTFLPSMLVGAFESELHDVLEEALTTNRYTGAVNIGAAEGYYAVGLAQRLPAACVYAYDGLPAAQALCREVAELNSCGENVIVRGLADERELNKVLKEHTLLVIDCDGCETTVLDPENVHALTTTDILVEVHDYMDPCISPTIKQRFAATHTIQEISPMGRKAREFPSIQFLSPIQRQFALHEYRRRGNFWLFLRAHRNNAQ